MCDVLDRVENKGRTEEKKAVAFNLKKMGLSDEMIAKAVNVSVALIKQWLGVSTAQ